MSIPACKDCKHCQDWQCHHPDSERVRTDYYEGIEETVFLPFKSARTLGPCYKEGRLFEPLTAEILLNSGVAADGP